MKRKRLIPVYSGDKSIQFWKIINSFKGKTGEKAYELGCSLQNLESKTLCFIKTK